MTIKQEILEALGDIPSSTKEKIWYFINWYNKQKPEDRCEEEWDNSSAKKSTMGWSWDYCNDDILKRPQVQNALKVFLEKDSELNIMKIYEGMYRKALTGDVKCADWIMKFYKSDFFKNNSEEDEINAILGGINIEGVE